MAIDARLRPVRATRTPARLGADSPAARDARVGREPAANTERFSPELPYKDSNTAERSPTCPKKPLLRHVAGRPGTGPLVCVLVPLGEPFHRSRELRRPASKQRPPGAILGAASFSPRQFRAFARSTSPPRAWTAFEQRAKSAVASARFSRTGQHSGAECWPAGRDRCHLVRVLSVWCPPR